MNLSDLKLIDYITNAKNVNKRCTKTINRLIKKFPCIYEFCNSDPNKFVLLLRKGVWIAGKDLMKLHYLTKKPFTAN